ncbi:MAG: DNA gyrase subunit A [Chloroflexota bacterium]|nr:DNA gyrase subunit A [Chloroflexota bacterium]
MDIGVVKPVKLEDEVRVSYLDYAMSVIVSRSLPDVRDGLKPVHRRILYAMSELGVRHNTPYKKSARIVGEVLGKYHPHGDAPVYEALVRMAQDFSMRHPLVDGQGNFGSVDNDPPAAMRYTEARLAAISQEMLVDLDKDTVDFVPNFDDSLKEPTVLPARLPNLLVNGSSGIAVGMATNIPPHNLCEVCDAIIQLIDNPAISVSELVYHVKGPDFPTGGIILGQEGVQKAYSTGQGKIVVQAKSEIEERAKGRQQVVITELPYQVNKAELVERIAKLVKERKIDGISELRDESDRNGMRILIELKKEARPRQVLNNLYKHTVLRTAFFVNMLALVDGQPKVVNLKEMLGYYIEHRQEIITRRCTYELKQAKDRAHILEGLKIALDNLDLVINTIRNSSSADAARHELMSAFGLTQIQAQAILDMQLRRLAALERQKILDELEETLNTIAHLEDLLGHPEKILALVRSEVEELKQKHGNARRTQLIEEEATAFQLEDLIPRQQMVVTLSERGYIKAVPFDAYRLQHRGGRGSSGINIRDEDNARLFLTADTHDIILFITSKGKAYALKCHQVPLLDSSGRASKGISIANLLPLDPKEQITSALSFPQFIPDRFLLQATKKGEIKKTALENLRSIRSNGLIVMNLEEGDELVGTAITEDDDEVILVNSSGQANRFAVNTLRAASRTSGGVRGMRLDPEDIVVGMNLVSRGTHILLVTTNGFGKLTPVEAFPKQGRGGKGRIAYKCNLKTGKLIDARIVSNPKSLMILSAQGITIRVPVENIPIQGRSTQGITLMRLDSGDQVVSITCFQDEEEEKRAEEYPPDTDTIQPSSEDNETGNNGHSPS